jgi:hypothetical protein
MNTTGALRFRATRVGAETALQQIVRLVQEAQGRRAPIARMADAISAWFTPAVIAASIVTFIAWFALGPAESRLSSAMVSAVAVLIIACPCAMGLATPTAILVGTGKGAEMGVLIRGGDVLERAASVTTVVLDKTGTLTQGAWDMGHGARGKGHGARWRSRLQPRRTVWRCSTWPRPRRRIRSIHWRRRLSGRPRRAARLPRGLKPPGSTTQWRPGH